MIKGNKGTNKYQESNFSEKLSRIKHLRDREDSDNIKDELKKLKAVFKVRQIKTFYSYLQET